MLSVQSCSVNSQNVAFNAKQKKSNVNSTSTSHAGLKTAAVWSSIVTPLGLANIYLNRLSNNSFPGVTYGKMNPKGKDLGKIFKKSVGKSPQEFLMNYRMVKATELLKLTDLSIADIGKAVSYENQLHFSRAFKTILGISPRHWRKQNK